MRISLYNTKSRSIEPFEPLKKDVVGMYCCGPTVYNFAHIGNLRTYLFEDVLRRTIEYFGYRVEHVMNITDVGHLTDDADDGEDKMVKASKEKKLDVYTIAKMYTDAFFEDTKALNILKPTVICKATDHIKDMINLIKRLEEKGHTYIAGGNVYFSTDTFERYGELTNLTNDHENRVSRVEVDKNKRNPKDFVLWFTKSKFENQVMVWPSPWGEGYPGWHIECSAMSMKYLGESFDIHCGGVDHVSVHHTNEIAQSEAATGKEWVKYWIHGEFLLDETGKMAKSKGEFLTLALLVEKGYHPLDYRFFNLGAHYRSQLVFSWEALKGAQNGRRKLANTIKRLKQEATLPNKSSESDTISYVDQFYTHLANDLNTPRALATLWTMLQDNSKTPNQKLAAIEKMDKVLGLDLLNEQIKEEEPISEEILELIRQRTEAKEQKNYTLADNLRAIVEQAGYKVVDTPNGTEVEKKM
ncbi:MAG: cysteine--tRNA ligase [Sphaerochaetaceae bacterium]